MWDYEKLEAIKIYLHSTKFEPAYNRITVSFEPTYNDIVK